MKSMARIYKFAFVTALVLLTISAWGESRRPLYLPHPTNVGGKTLAQGNYTVRWEGASEHVQVKIYKGRSEVVSVPARLIQLNSAAEFNCAVLSGEGEPQSLSEIRFGGKKFALRIPADASGASSATAAKKSR